MVAILAQQIVLSPHEHGRCALHDGVDFGCWQEREAVKNAAAEGGAGWCCQRWRVVDAGFVGVRVSAVGVFNCFAVRGGDGYAGVVQGRADCPEDC